MNFEKYLNEPIGIESELSKYFINTDNLNIFEIGACEGEDSIKYSRIFPNAKIYSFEPVKENFDKIANNLEKYNIKNVVVFNEALSNNVGNSDFYLSSGHPDYLPKTNDWDYGNKSSSLLPPKNHQPKWMSFEKKEQIRNNTILNFCEQNKIQYIDFVHMDVQGAELMVLEGTGSFLKNIKMIWLEVSLVEFYENQPLKNNIIDFLNKNGFIVLKEACSHMGGDVLFLNENFKQLSLCIPTYNSSSFFEKSFIKVLNNSIVKEIIINDDNSNDYEDLLNKVELLNNKKISVYKNEKNLKPFHNKYEIVKKSKTDWVILLDSDNIIDNDYIYKIYDEDWIDTIILCPEKALPNFKYSHILDVGLININNCRHFERFQFDTFLNTGNYFFNKDKYVKNWEIIPFEEKESLLDVIYYNAYWLINGNGLKIISGLEYQHTIRNNSFYMEKQNETQGCNDLIIKKILQHAK